MSQSDLEKDLLGYLGDPRWRLNNLYSILTDAGQVIPFRMNDAQHRLYENMHYLNIHLKARQLGFTTFIQLFMLDTALFNSNIRCGTIAHNLESAQIIFRDRVKFPYDHLPDQLKDAIPIKNSNLSEIMFANNSSLRIGTSMRSGTLNILHISELGKIAAKYPARAQEIRSGSLNTVHTGQLVFVESTAEGRSGDFFDMCEVARGKQRRRERLTELDFKFFFWPWYGDSRYRLKADFELPEPMVKYFDELEVKHRITLTPEQKAWYVKRYETQLSLMKREFPSTPDEAFEASAEGAYYGDEMAKAEYDGRIDDEHTFRPNLPIHTAWDIGVGDYTAIWFFQVFRGKILLCFYYQNSGEGMPFYDKKLKEFAQRFKWHYGSHWFPHDIKVKEWGTGLTRFEQVQRAGIRPKRVPDARLEDGINAARAILPRCYFTKSMTTEGVAALKAYRKEWDDKAGAWKDTPLHDWSSHAADAFRYLALANRVAMPPSKKPKSKPIDDGMSKLTLEQLFVEHDKHHNPDSVRIV